MTAERFSGRRVLITGATSGVGLAAARLFLGEGARVAALARREAALDDALGEAGAGVVRIAVDLGDRPATEAAVSEAVERLGGLDVLVANAASAVFGHTLEVHPEDFDRTVAVTFTGAVNVVRAALPHLRESGGTIVATGSLNSRAPLPGWGSYAASKHALRGFLNTLAIEERERATGVRVALVHPGPIDTPLFSHASSATGRMPRVPPDAYGAEVVARALVEAAVDGRPEVVLGGFTRAVDLLFTGARPVAEGLLMMIDRWYRSGTADAPRPGSLWAAPVVAQESGGIPARDSLFAPLQLGRRLLPSASTPLRLAGHLASAAGIAARAGGALLQGTPEVPPPRESLRAAGEQRAPATRGEAHVADGLDRVAPARANRS